MRIIIEEHKYAAADVKDVLKGINALEDIEGYVSVNYVGYFYNTDANVHDCVFILPKVLLEDVDGQELVFGKYSPEDIINLDSHNPLSQEEKDFLYEFAVWIYRAIVVFQENKKDCSSIVYHKKIAQVGQSNRQVSNTFLDILLSLIRFNKDNQSFFFYILRNIHSGFNKINWNRTIATKTAIIQNGNAVYLNAVNKKRQINFDEELLIIFFSILNYINEHYGFPVEINCNFELITGNQFKTYLNGMGKLRLEQIKYKYFSDKAQQLWGLCYDFFNATRRISANKEQSEYLLVKNFNIVFESIIDELIGDSNIPARLKEQGDGKRVDHMYQYRNLTNNKDDNPIYYIGDSKYYKRNSSLGSESVYKQFTYARNVIQWNLDLFNDGTPSEQNGHVKLRDEQTEGYNIIPNFFISAQQRTLDRQEHIELTDKKNKYFQSRQFDNRLFDRDTFLIAHYDVNFLFVIALFGRNNKSEKAAWRDKVREMFRKEIQTMLQEKFNFFVMTAKEGVSAVNYIEEHFQQLLGKVFTPYEDRGQQKFYSLALDNRKEFENENNAILSQLKDSFYIEKCAIGDDPKELLPEVTPFSTKMIVPSQFLTMHFLEKYIDKYIVVGCYKDKAHLEWILGKNDKGTLIYNIRLGKERNGGQVKARLLSLPVCFAVLYEYGCESENKYRVFRVHHHASMTAERMKQAWYPSDPGSKNYFCYVFDEEVSLGNININSLISYHRISDKEFIDGMPIFVKGEELIVYRQ